MLSSGQQIQGFGYLPGYEELKSASVLEPPVTDTKNVTSMAKEVDGKKVYVVCGFKRFWHHFQGLWQIYKICIITHINGVAEWTTDLFRPSPTNLQK